MTRARPQARQVRWPDPPGYQDTVREMKAPRYGWAVLTAPPHVEIAVISITDWETAKQGFPYRWLNTHPKQPAPPGETLELAKATYKAALKARRERLR